MWLELHLGEQELEIITYRFSVKSLFVPVFCDYIEFCIEIGVETFMIPPATTVTIANAAAIAKTSIVIPVVCGEIRVVMALQKLP